MAAGPEIELVISSDLQEVLSLPWELASPPDGEILGFDQRIGIRRSPVRPGALHPPEAKLSAGPLRVLFTARRAQAVHGLHL